MAISRVTKLFATVDAKVAKMLTDPAGGTATYDTAIDVPGIKSVTIDGNIDEKILRGDYSQLDSDSTLTNITVVFEYAKLSLDVLAALLGGTVTDGGSGSVETATYALLGTSSLFNNFKFEAVVPKVDIVAGDAHLILYKCRLNAFPSLGTAEDDYQTFSIGGTASPRLADSKWIDVVLNEEATAIAP